jgi:hypothetical protein
MKMLARTLPLVFLLTASLNAAVPLSAPIDPAPPGQATDEAIPVALLPMQQSMLAVFNVQRVIDKYGPAEIYVRALGTNGEPLGASQRFIAFGRRAAAATDGSTTLIAWVGDGIQAQLVDGAGRTVAGPVQLSKRGPALSFTPGVYSVNVVSSSEGWIVKWSFSEYASNAFRYGTETVTLDEHLLAAGAPQIESPTNALLASALSREATVGVFSRPDGTYVDQLADDDASIGTLISTSSSLTASAQWSSSVLAVAHASSTVLNFTTLDRSLQVLSQHATPLDQPCSSLSIAPTSGGWATLCSTSSYPAAAKIFRFNPAGNLENASDISPIDRAPSFLASSESRLWLLSGSRLFEADGNITIPHFVIASRAASTRLAAPVRWENGDRLVIFEQNGTLFSNFVTMAGEIRFPQPFALGRITRMPFVTTRRDNDVFVVAQGDTGQILAFRFDRTSASPVPVVTSAPLLAPTGQPLGVEASAGPAGLAILWHSYSEGGGGQLLLDDSLHPLAERSKDAFLLANEQASGTQNVLVGYPTADGYAIEVCDRHLQPVKPASTLIPAHANPADPVMSAYEGRVLVAWINNTDHLRTLTLDEAGNVIAGADGGRTVTAGGSYKTDLSVEPAPEGWWLNWSSRSTSNAQATDIYRILVDRDGKLVTPLPHEPLYTVTHPPFAGRAVNAEGDTVFYTAQRFDEPFSGAVRGVLMLPEGARRRAMR